MTVTYWIIGRVWCPHCQILRATVKHPEAEIVCPRCGTECVVASGLDEREDA